jgi:hypothetical protein
LYLVFVRQQSVLSKVWITFFAILTCQYIDFRQSGLTKTIKWLILFLLSGIVTVLLAYSIISFDPIAELLKPYKFLPLPGKITSLMEYSLILLIFFIAGRAILLFNATDILWLGRFLFTPKLRTIYFTVIFTFYIAQNTIAERSRLAWSVAKNKFRLSRKAQGIKAAILVGGRLFIRKLVVDNYDLTLVTDSLLRERGFYVNRSRHPLQLSWNPEDFLTFIILIMVLFLYFFISN